MKGGEMDEENKRGTGSGAAAEKGNMMRRRHGSTALFVAVDYAFLLAFAGFLSYLVVSQLLSSVASSSTA
ncbi:hypothetical protein GUJ93_ZPchr0009g2192 [Zizania palustris]|uniref:Uncharacterized protein n=1 Tax=Zizania palustris TaxID=103762 RepID=A0A8J5V8J9_ZIZPA|nr:hypothetical protein GUJ93_ZPchr0009g2192 [Zizania palustris]